MREKFIFHRSYLESLKDLPKTIRLNFLECICIYALDGTEPTNLKPALSALFKAIKSTVDATQKSYDAKVKNGKLGGAPQGNNNAQKQPKSTENNLNQPKTTLKEKKRKEKKGKENKRERENIKRENETVPVSSHSHTPTLIQILSYAKELKIDNEDYCDKFYNHYEGVGWITGTGQEIKNWKLIFISWCKKDGLLKKEDEKIDTSTVFEDEYGKYRLNENGKRIAC